MSTMKQYRDLVSTTELKDLDIGVLCLNAGLALMGPVDLVDDRKFETVWNVTGLHNAYLLKALVQKLLDRDKRVAVLFTSSMAAEMLFAGNANYSATKALVSNYGESVHYELKSNIDVTVWEPGMVYSNFHIRDPPGAMTVETKKAVADALCCLGKDRKTRGSLFFTLTPSLPAQWYAPGMAKKARDKFMKIQELEDEKEKKRQ